jgi:ribosomal protein L15
MEDWGDTDMQDEDDEDDKSGEFGADAIATSGRGRGRGSGAAGKSGRGGRGAKQKAKKDQPSKAAKAPKGGGNNLCMICPDKKAANNKFCRAHERAAAVMKYQAERDNEMVAYNQVFAGTVFTSSMAVCNCDFKV